MTTPELLIQDGFSSHQQNDTTPFRISPVALYLLVLTSHLGYQFFLLCEALELEEKIVVF
jgi:hypothetical protein